MLYHVLLGLYDAQKLFSEDGIERYLTEMVQPASLFGDAFIFAPIVLQKGQLLVRTDLQVIARRETALLDLHDTIRWTEDRVHARAMTARREDKLVGILVVSPSQKRKNVFQSTWYHINTVPALLALAGFTEEQFDLTITPSGKGIIVAAAPLAEYEESPGLITSLNNVIGCVYVHDQVGELAKLRRIAMGEPLQTVFVPIVQD